MLFVFLFAVRGRKAVFGILYDLFVTSEHSIMENIVGISSFSGGRRYCETLLQDYFVSFFAILAHESRKATVRLNTGASSVESTESTQK